MNKRGLLICIVLLTLSLFDTLKAHSGRTDSNGGHYNRSTGEYHYHNSGNAIIQKKSKIEPRSNSRAGNYKTRLEEAVATQSTSDREGNYLTRWQVKNGIAPSQQGIESLGRVDYEELAKRRSSMIRDKRGGLRLSQAVREAKEAIKMRESINADRLKNANSFRGVDKTKPSNIPKGEIIYINLKVGTFRSLNGTYYKDAKCIKRQGELVTISHKYGVSRINASVLPASVRFKIGM